MRAAGTDGAGGDAPVGPLAVGAAAPGFALPRAPGQTLTLRALRGRPVVLVFYPADWEPASVEQLTLYQRLLPEFERHGAALLAISTDGVWCHAAFAAAHRLSFPLLADFEPKGAVARAYGAYRGTVGVAARALFLVDAAGAVRWRHVAPDAANPGADGVLTALEALAPPARPPDADDGPRGGPTSGA